MSRSATPTKVGARSRASSVAAEVALPNAGRPRTHSFVNPFRDRSSSDEDSTSASASASASAVATPEVTPRVLEPDQLRSTMNEVLSRLCYDIELCSAVLEDDLGDVALNVLIKVLGHASMLLPLIREQVQIEFLHNATEKDAILRGNCVATRMMSAYCGVIGQAWILKTLKGTVKRLLREESAWVVDFAKAPGATNEEKLAALKVGQARLLDIATCFLRKLHKAVGATPIAVRCMAYFVWINARTFCPEKSAVLLGGFVFLRIINPALVSPETVPGLMPEGAVVLPVFKQNCVSLCRLLQNLSNQKLYQDPNASVLNDWLSLNHEPLESYLLDLATDPAFVEGRRPFSSICRVLESEEQNNQLRDHLGETEWDALHVALIKCKMHVLVRHALAPVINSGGVKSPGRKAPSGISTPKGAALVSSSLPSSPNRSRSGSRFRGEEEELAIYNDGKMRVRATRRPSLGGGLFANLSQPNLSAIASRGSGSAPATPSADETGGSASPAPAAGNGNGNGAGPCAGSHRSSRSRTLSAVGSPQMAVAAPRDSGSEPSGAALRESAGAGDPVADTNVAAFYAALELIPLPPAVRREQFAATVAPLTRSNLQAEGILSESRRGSVKIAAPQAELLHRLGLCLLDPEFGVKVESFTGALFAEWSQKWLEVEAPKDVEMLLSLLVRCNVLIEKGSKANKGYAIDVERMRDYARSNKR